MLFKPRPFSLAVSIAENLVVTLIIFILNTCIYFDGNWITDALISAIEIITAANVGLYLLVVLRIARRGSTSATDRLFARGGLITMIVVSYAVLTLLAGPLFESHPPSSSHHPNRIPPSPPATALHTPPASNSAAHPESAPTTPMPTMPPGRTKGEDQLLQGTPTSPDTLRADAPHQSPSRAARDPQSHTRSGSLPPESGTPPCPPT